MATLFALLIVLFSRFDLCVVNSTDPVADTASTVDDAVCAHHPTEQLAEQPRPGWPVDTLTNTTLDDTVTFTDQINDSPPHQGVTLPLPTALTGADRLIGLCVFRI